MKLVEVLLFTLGGVWQGIRQDFNLLEMCLIAAFAVEPFAAFLARFRSHLGLVEKAMGGLLVLTGIAFLTGAVGQFSYWLLDTFPSLGNIG